jgi:sulfate adenylyltransferase subunit 1 (EFTu-like GTPase family)
MSVTTLFDINAAKRQMPADEIWLFEYSLADGRKYVIHFSADKVDQVVEGALLKE